MPLLCYDPVLAVGSVRTGAAAVALDGGVVASPGVRLGGDSAAVVAGVAVDALSAPKLVALGAALAALLDLFLGEGLLAALTVRASPDPARVFAHPHNLDDLNTQINDLHHKPPHRDKK